MVLQICSSKTYQLNIDFSQLFTTGSSTVPGKPSLTWDNSPKPISLNCTVASNPLYRFSPMHKQVALGRQHNLIDYTARTDKFHPISSPKYPARQTAHSRIRIVKRARRLPGLRMPRPLNANIREVTRYDMLSRHNPHWLP